jgi:hypothetical protein
VLGVCFIKQKRWHQHYISHATIQRAILHLITITFELQLNYHVKLLRKLVPVHRETCILNFITVRIELYIQNQR